MNPAIAVLCFLAIAYSAHGHHVHSEPEYKLSDDLKTNLAKPGYQYNEYKTQTETITLTENTHVETHKGMNVDRKNEEVDTHDLNLIFWNPELKYAIKKALIFLEDDKGDKILVDELKNDHEKKEIKVALVECTYYKSHGLRQSCLADQILTYSALSLDQADMDSLFTHLGGSGEAAPVAKLKELIDAEMIAEEMGVFTAVGTESTELKKTEYLDYIKQETLLDDFRNCRKKLEPNAETTGNIDFEDSCLAARLKEYVEDDLTELDIAVIFGIIDENDNNKITKAELKKLRESAFTEDKLKAAMEVLDMSITTAAGAEPEIDYAEFRTFMRSPTVLYQAEKECTEPKEEQAEEIACLMELFIDLALDAHTPIWLTVPDIEQTMAFEIIDLDDNGLIERADLKGIERVGVSSMHDAAVTKFITEMDSNDYDTNVDLEEFNEYVDIPHMVYGMADCLLEARTVEGRGRCFPDEVIDTIDNIKYLDEDAIESWFDYFAGTDKKIDASDPLEQKLKSQANEDLFLVEVGQGSKEVYLFEFRWYFKQQNLAEVYEKTSIITSHTGRELTHYQLTNLNEEIILWLNDEMTEYDIIELFKQLDGNKDTELTPADFAGADEEKMKQLLVYIDGLEPYGDEDTKVNYREFWLWINSDNVAGSRYKRRSVKDIFELDCTVPKTTHAEELQCYGETFKKPHLFLAAEVTREGKE